MEIIFALRQPSKKCRAAQREMHAAFIDLEKAFDRVPRKPNWESLGHKVVPGDNIRIVKEMCRGRNEGEE